MTTRSFCMLAAAIFALIALLQLLRIFMEWSVTLNGVVIRFWASWIAVIVASALSFVVINLGVDLIYTRLDPRVTLFRR